MGRWRPYLIFQTESRQIIILHLNYKDSEQLATPSNNTLPINGCENILPVAGLGEFSSFRLQARSKLAQYFPKYQK